MKNNSKYIAKGIASVAVCALGAYMLYLTNGVHGIGWSIIGLFFIWAS